MQEVVTYEGGGETVRRAFPNRMRSRASAALRTVGRRSHYYLEKFVTPGFARAARRILADPSYGIVLHSYLTTASVATLPDPHRRHLVWTHNDEFKWFEDLGREARNPLAKAVSAASLRWLCRFLARHERDLLLLHVTEEDRAGWARRFPDHRAAVVPIGVTPWPVAPPLPAEAPVRLLFVGALGVGMNHDALAHFAARFWPVLHARFGDALSMTAAGSTPLSEVRALCSRMGWTLRADVPDDALDRLYREATFALLPFAYATGAKLKLLGALAYGIPVLATPAVGAQAGLVVPPSLMSDDPAAWAAHVAHVRKHGIAADDRARLHALAEAHSWDASARRLLTVARADA